LKHILAEGPLPHSEAGVRFIRYLLNGSIDARVIDYVRRDSHHLGIYKGDAFELQNLLPHIRFRNGQMVVQSTGLSAVEEIITLRYWLFNRIYWNRPNRTMIAMIKFVLMALHGVPGFLRRMREAALNGSEDSMLELFYTEAHGASLPHVRELCVQLMPERPLLYEELLQFNRSDGDANTRQLCDRYQELSLADEVELQKRVNTHFIKTFNMSSNRQHVLLDLPVEYGPKKLGEDVNILNYRGEPRALTKVSGIVEGVQKGFTEHLQRLRVFVHPDSWAELEHKRKDVKDAVGETLLSLI
jgi:HD superfamily phosphohydrolase